MGIVGNLRRRNPLGKNGRFRNDEQSSSVQSDRNKGRMGGTTDIIAQVFGAVSAAALVNQRGLDWGRRILVIILSL